MVQQFNSLNEANVKLEMAFSREEYDRRVAKVRRAMGEQGIDVLLVHHTPNFCYLTGYQSPLANWYGCMILSLEGEPIAHISDIEVANLMIHGWDNENIHTVSWMWPGEGSTGLPPILKERGFGNVRIGVELRLPGCSGLTYQALVEGLSDATIVDASDLVLDIRAVKSEAELACIREAARMSDVGAEAGLGAVADGKQDNDIFAAIVHALAEAGSEYLSIQPLVYVGARTTLPHVVNKRRTMKRGDTATMELTGVYQRYGAPIFRTAVVGPPSDDVKRMTDFALARLSLLYEEAKPGRVASDVARAVEAGMKGKEIPGATGRGAVYSVGIAFPPDWVDHATFVTERHDRVLEPGMAFHTPSGCVMLNKTGVAYSETMVITETGNETLSKLPRELTVV